MKKTKIIKIIKKIIVFVVLLLALTGCGKENTQDAGVYFHHSIADQTQADSDTQVTEADAADEDLYLVVAVDQIEETLRLYRYENGMEYRYYYGTGTRFLDKYGNRTTVASFVQGLLVTIGNVNREGILCDAQISDNAWVYDDVKRFSISSDPAMLQIGDSK